jgi:serpin B
MKKFMLSGVVVLLALLSSCAQKEMLNEKGIPSGQNSADRMTSPASVIKGLNEFSFNIYCQLNAASENNEFISPLSISSVLAMTYAGAEEQTAEEMKQALHFGAQDPEFHQIYGRILDSLAQSSGDFEINIANAVWVQKAFPLLGKFTKTVRDNYKGESRELNFIHQPVKSKETINKWVSDKTNDKIPELLSDGVIDADTRMILTNAVYFNAEWYESFNKKMTNEAPFYLLNGGQTTCDLMYQRSRLAYMETKDLQIVELFYKGRQYSMTILLPKKTDGLKELDQTVDQDLLAQFDMNKKWEDILLYVPKFKMDSDYELKPALSALGMKEAFSDDADFKGMTGEKDLKISSVIHKAFIEVDEEKTEAAAATAVVMKMTSAMPVERSPIEFRADHPFMFLIRHTESGAIVFMGQITNPK